MWYSRKTSTVHDDSDAFQNPTVSGASQIKSRLQAIKSVFSFAAVLSFALSKTAWAAGQTLVYTGAQNTVTEATAVAGAVVVLGIIGAGVGMIIGNSSVMKYGGYTVAGGGLALGGTAIRDYIFGGAASGAVIDAITMGSF